MPTPDFAASDLLAFFEFAPGAQMIILPDDPAFTIAAVNAAFLRISGATREQTLGKRLFDVFPDNPKNGGARNLSASLKRAIASKSPDQLELQRYDVELQDGRFGERYWNAVNTPVQDDTGRVRFILHSVEEVTEKVLADRGLQRFRHMAETSKLGLVFADLDGGVSYANLAMLELLEYSKADLEAGLLRWDRITPPEFAALDAEAVRQIKASGTCAPFEKVYLTKSGKRIPVLIGASLVQSTSGHEEVAAFVVDLTERKQSERDAFLVRLDDATRPLLDPDQILKAAARLLGEHLKADHCAYGTLESDQDTLHISTECIHPALNGHDFHQHTARHAISDFGPELSRTLRANLACVASESNFGSLAAVPLIKEGKLVAAMGVQQQASRKWLPEEVEFLRLVSNRCWESMERSRAAHSSRSAEQMLRLAQKVAHVGTFEWLIKEDRIVWTPELEALYGLPEGAFEGKFKDWSKRVFPEDVEQVVHIIRTCQARQQSECIYEFRAILPDGSLRWLRGRSHLFYDHDGVAERMIGVNIDIDSQKLAENQLRENEQRLRAIFDGTYEYIGLMSPDGTLLEANRASLEFAGNRLEDVVGKQFWETDWFSRTPGAPEQVSQAVARAATGEFVRFEASLQTPSGEWPTFDISLHPVKNEQGDVVLIVPEGRDITRVKQTQEQLQQQWHLFDTALSHTPDHTYMFDLEGRFTYANRTLLQMWKRTFDQAVGKNFFELGYAPELAGKVHQQIQDVIRTKQPVRDHTQLKEFDGGTPYFDYIFVPVLGANGKVEAVAGSSREITDRIRAEQNLKRIFEQAPVAIIVLRGHDFVIELANSTYQQLLPGKHLVGRRFGDVVPELGQDVFDAFNRVLATGEPFVANEWLIPYDADGDGVVEDHWFNLVYNPLRDSDGTVSGIIAVMTRVTAQVRARLELERVNRELEEFSYVASHDLQEPLRMVNIYTHLILREMNGTQGKLSQYAGFVREGVTRMDMLLGDLLNFSRTVHADAPQTNIKADLSAALSDAMSVLANRIDESGARVTADRLPTTHGDPQQLSHVFQNLLSNAIKYSKKGIAPEIHISAACNGTEWTIAFADKGIGFEPQYAERIFGLFKRLHKDEYPGTGLGLAICQRIVQRYGGRMWAEGRLSEGATFYFSLPAACPTDLTQKISFMDS